MKLLGITMTPLLWAVSALAVLLAVWLLWWAVIIRPADNARKAAESAAQATLSETRTGSAKEATHVSDGVSRATAATEDTTRKNRDEILAQPGASVLVSPEVANAGRRAICLRQSARNDPECKRLLAASPVKH
jgi:flagellar biosynthesis/type III secretory pathway M-ring protein FliF/YscJ